MDLQMPIMDGYTAAEEIRKLSSTIPILALTADTMNDVLEKVMKSGMNDMISKPFQPDEIRKKILKLITI